MTFQHFKFDIDADGIALVTWDSPGRSMNVIDLKVIEELSAIVEQVASEAAIKGAVITSAKDTFSAGADLTLLEGLGRVFADLAKSKGPEAAATALFEESRKLSLLYRRLETSGKPWAAGSSSPLRAITASRRRIQKPGSACPRSRSGCFPAPEARRASRACCRPATRCSSCSRAISCGSSARRR